MKDLFKRSIFVLKGVVDMWLIYRNTKKQNNKMLKITLHFENEIESNMLLVLLC